MVKMRWKWRFIRRFVPHPPIPYPPALSPIAIGKGSLTSVVPGVKRVLNGDALQFSTRKLIGKDLWVMYSQPERGDFQLHCKSSTQMREEGTRSEVDISNPEP